MFITTASLVYLVLMYDTINNAIIVVVNNNVVAMIVLTFLCLLCAFTLCVGYIAARCSSIASMGFGANLRSALFNQIQDLSFENIDKLKISSLITRMTSDVSMLQSVYSNTIVTFIKGPFMLITALVYALKISKDLSLSFAFALPAIIIILTIMGVIAVPLFKKMLKTTDKFNGVLRGNINGIRVVKSFVREDEEEKKFLESYIENMYKPFNGNKLKGILRWIVFQKRDKKFRAFIKKHTAPKPIYRYDRIRKILKRNNLNTNGSRKELIYRVESQLSPLDIFGKKYLITDCSIPLVFKRYA